MLGHKLSDFSCESADTLLWILPPHAPYWPERHSSLGNLFAIKESNTLFVSCCSLYKSRSCLQAGEREKKGCKGRLQERSLEQRRAQEDNSLHLLWQCLVTRDRLSWTRWHLYERSCCSWVSHLHFAQIHTERGRLVCIQSPTVEQLLRFNT